MSNLNIDTQGFPVSTAWNGLPIEEFRIRVGRGGGFISGCDTSVQRLFDAVGLDGPYVDAAPYSNVATQMVSNNHQTATDYQGVPTLAADSSYVCVVISAYVRMNGELCLAHKAERRDPWTLDGSSGWLWIPNP